MTESIHPLAPHHLPRYFPAADGSDYLFTAMVVLVLAAILLFGIAYLTLHSLPEHLGHKTNSRQIQLISILGIMALFTHNNLFWVAALVLAVFQPPDFLTPLNSIAKSLQNLSDRKG